MITLNRQKAAYVFNDLNLYKNLYKQLPRAYQRDLLTLRNKYLIGEAITSNDLAKLASLLHKIEGDYLDDIDIC